MQTTRKNLKASVVGAFLLATHYGYAAPFNIELNFTGGLTPSQQSIFTTAANTWESLISGYQAGISISSLTINASGVTIDGAGGVLGQASPTRITRQGGRWLPTRGLMQFDAADISVLEAEGSFLAVVLHEMAHVMGFGSLWTLNGVYVNGSGRFTGANAIAAARVEFGRPGATFIPVELGGGSGTANAHWDERDGGVCCTGFVSNQGDATFELMTGWLNASSYISMTTVQSFVDIGYMAASGASVISVGDIGLAPAFYSGAFSARLPVPEPEIYALLASGLCFIGFIAHRRRKLAAV